MAPHAQGAYVNSLGQESLDAVCAAYGPEIHRRLTEVKDRYDPDNVFQHNQNVPPSARSR